MQNINKSKTSVLFPNGNFDDLWNTPTEEVGDIDYKEVEKFVNQKIKECLKDIEELYDLIKNHKKKDVLWGRMYDKEAIDMYNSIRQRYEDIFLGRGGGIPSSADLINWLYGNENPHGKQDERDPMDRVQERLNNTRYAERMKTMRKFDYKILTDPEIKKISRNERKPGYQPMDIYGNSQWGNIDVYNLKNITQYLEKYKDIIVFEKEVLEKPTDDRERWNKRKKISRHLIIELTFSLKILMEEAKKYKHTENEQIIKETLDQVIVSVKEIDNIKYHSKTRDELISTIK